MLSEEIKVQIDSHEKEFKKYIKFIKDNNWVEDINPQINYETEKLLTDSTMMVLSKFCEENKDYIKVSEVKKFIKDGLKVVDKHVERVDIYLECNDWTANIGGEEIQELKDRLAEYEVELALEVDETKKKEISAEIKDINKTILLLEKSKKDEIEFQAKAHNGKVVLLSKKAKLNLDGDKDKKSADSMFYSKAKAPLLMRSFLSKVIPDVKKFDEGIGINWDNPNPSTSSELFINMKKKDIPEYDLEKHYWEQDKDVIQFWAEELRKMKYGINLNGYKMSPYMYWTMNFYKIALGTGSKREIKNVDIRDNEYLFDYMLTKAEEHGRCGLLLYGTRRWSKSVNLASRLVYSLLTIENCQGSVQGFSGVDLGQLVNYMNESFSTLPNALRVNLIRNNDKGFEAGIKKTAQDAYTFGHLNFLNLEAGSKVGSQKTAGGTPSVSVFDEIGKGEILKPWGAALPSFEGGDNGKWRCTPILAGCVCAGTKVYTHEGNLVNIEDLTKEEGILGFDKERQEVSKEPITWMQPPSEKPCYRITTKKGHTIECSYEHPILVRHRDKKENRSGKNVRKIEFIPTEELKVGQQILIAESVDIWGTKKMWEPRLVGWLIGDGNYNYDQTPRLSSCDEEINSYVLENFETSKSRQDRLTKDGQKIYMENRIKGICPKLRELGIYGQTGLNKTLPKDLYKYSKKDLSELLGGLFDTDGHVSESGRNTTIGFDSKSESLIKEVRDLLNKFGIHPTYNRSVCKPTKLVPKETEVYRLSISDKRSVEMFYKEISFKIKYKQEALKRIVNKLSNRKEQIPSELKNCRLDSISNIEYIGVKPIYNLTAGTTNTYIANMIVTHNTAGEGELSKDAEEMLQDPKTFDLLLMDWDKLDSMAGENNRTWNRRPFSFFLPAQMNLSVPKIKTNYAEFVGVDNEELAKIPFYKTDWEKAKEHFETQRENKRKNQKALGEEIRFHPLDPEDVFLSGEKNPFDALQMKNWKAELILNDIIGGKYTMTMEDGVITPIFSDKPLIDTYPFKGGNIDCPVVILEHPDKEPMDDLYVIGFDDAKQETSSGDSVRSAVVFKRRAFLGDKYADSVVAYYDSRQDDPKDYYKQLYMLMKYYNARVFHENEDNGYVDFLEREFPADVRYLVPSINFTDALGDSFYVNKNRRYGYSPHGGNNNHLLRRTVAYTKEDVGDGMNNGYKRIQYPMLLEEMIQYRKENNADRLRAFGLAVIYSEFLGKMYIEPRKPKTWEKSQTNERKKNRLRGGLTSTNKFKKRF